MKNKKLLMLVEIAIFAGLGMVLDELAFSMPQGGSVSFGMLPIIMMALRWGLGAGLTAGLIMGILKMAFGAYILHWAQAILDYGVAFAAIGLAAVVRAAVLRTSGNERKLWLIAGVAIGGGARYIAHTVAGAIFFAEYAGTQNPWIYSIIYNATYMIPALILTAAVAILLFNAAPRLLRKA